MRLVTKNDPASDLSTHPVANYAAGLTTQDYFKNCLHDDLFQIIFIFGMF